MTVLLIFIPSVAADEWALVARGGGVDEYRSVVGLKRFWSTVDILAGSVGFLVFMDGCGGATVGVHSS